MFSDYIYCYSVLFRTFLKNYLVIIIIIINTNSLSLSQIQNCRSGDHKFRP